MKARISHGGDPAGTVSFLVGSDELFVDAGQAGLLEGRGQGLGAD